MVPYNSDPSEAMIAGVAKVGERAAASIRVLGFGHILDVRLAQLAAKHQLLLPD